VGLGSGMVEEYELRSYEEFVENNLRSTAFRDKYERRVKDAAFFIAAEIGYQPEWGITLGTGLGNVIHSIEPIEKEVQIPYAAIPHFPQTSATGHGGFLHFGKIANVSVIGLEGRVHYYDICRENNVMENITFAVHVLAELGVKNYFATNAAGGLHPIWQRPGDAMVIGDHLSMFLPSAVSGRQLNFTRVDDGEKIDEFLDMTDAYHPEFTEMLLQACEAEQGRGYKIVYAPNEGRGFETRAEVRKYIGDGAHAVGMSTVPSIQAARLRGMNCVAMSALSNVVGFDDSNKTSHEEHIFVLNRPAIKERLANIVLHFFEMYGEKYDTTLPDRMDEAA